MNLETLGYSDKWIEYGLLDEKTLVNQLKEFQSGVDENTEHYRYAAFLNWLQKKERLTNKEIENYIELAQNDADELMGGAAVKDLFQSIIVDENQYNYIKHRLPEFGEWTLKLISRQDLLKIINSKKITHQLFQKCWEHKIKFNENQLIEIILDKTNDIQIIEFIINSDILKKIRLRAQHKLTNILNKNL